VYLLEEEMEEEEGKRKKEVYEQDPSNPGSRMS
jgi:hypothetical protein